MYFNIKKKPLLLIAVTVFFVQSFVSVQAASLSLGGTMRINKQLKSVKTIKEEGVVMQNLDYSCGAASLATLMQYYYNEKVTEKDILDAAKHVLTGDTDKVKEKGLSLLDLKQIAQHFGYKSAGFNLSAESLKNLNGPVIIHFKPNGYEHFAVLKGVRGDRVYLADPSRGNYRESIYKFIEEWNGITLALDKNGNINSQSVLSVSEIINTHPEIQSVRQMLRFGDLLTD